MIGQFERERASAKAPHPFRDVYGTTEVVPFQDGFKLTHFPAIDERARKEQRDVYFISLPSPKKEVSLER
jgi:hypothetical protein